MKDSEKNTIPGTLPRSGGRPRPKQSGIPGTIRSPEQAKPPATTPRRQKASGAGQPQRKKPAAKSTSSAARQRSGPARPRPATSAQQEKRAAQQRADAAARRKRIAVALFAVIAVVAMVAAALFIKSKLDAHKQNVIAAEQVTPDEIVPCTPDMLDTTMAITGTRAGSPTSFTIGVTNSSDTSCSLDAGRAHLVLSVTSGNDKIWQSNHCVAEPAPDLYVFGPGVSSEIAVHWDGQRSTEACQGGLPTPGPGTYVVEAAIDGVAFDELKQVFELTAAQPQPAEEAPAEDDQAPAEEAPAEGESGE